MKQRWQKLSLREKQIVTVGMILLGILFTYVVIFAPLNAYVLSLRQQTLENQRLLVWMEESDKRLQQLQKTLSSLSSNGKASLLGVIQKQISNSPFANKVTQLQQEDNNSIHLILNKVSFDELMTWLTQIWQRNAIIVTQINITQSELPGIVEADFKLASGIQSAR